MTDTKIPEKRRALIVFDGRVHAVRAYGPVPTDDVVWVRTSCGVDRDTRGMTAWSNLISPTCRFCNVEEAVLTDIGWDQHPGDDYPTIHAASHDDVTNAMCGDVLFGNKWHVLQWNSRLTRKVGQTAVENVNCLNCQQVLRNQGLI